MVLIYKDSMTLISKGSGRPGRKLAANIREV